MIDKDKLLAYLATRNLGGKAGRAMDEGLSDRIRRGDFDEDNDKEVT